MKSIEKDFYKDKGRRDGLSPWCRSCHSADTHKRQQAYRLRMMDLLGGRYCKRCSFDDVRALVFDHVEGGGNHHRARSISMWSICKDIEAHPERYQVFCCNCNQIKRHEEGEWATKAYVAKVREQVSHYAERPERWSKNHDACVECSTTERKHFGHGMCHRCYMRDRRSTAKSVVSTVTL